MRGRSLRSLRPSRHARRSCFSSAVRVRCSRRLSGPQPSPPPVRRRVPASKLARVSGPPLLITPLAGVSPEQPSRQPGAGCHAACGGLTFPPYRSLRSLGGNRPGSPVAALPARPGAGLAPRDRWPSAVRRSLPSQAPGRAPVLVAGAPARGVTPRCVGPAMGRLSPAWFGGRPWGRQRWGAALDPHRRQPAAPGNMMKRADTPLELTQPAAGVAAGLIGPTHWSAAVGPS